MAIVVIETEVVFTHIMLNY